MAIKQLYRCLLISFFLRDVSSQLSTDQANEEIAVTLDVGILTPHVAPTSLSYDSTGATSTNTPEERICTTESELPITYIGSMSRTVYEDFKDVYAYLQFALVSLAILTNVCNIAVFTKKRMGNTVSTILIFLSCSELANAIIELTASVYLTFFYNQTFLPKSYWYLFQWGRMYMAVVFQRCAICFNLFVATQRFVAVRFPLRIRRHLRGKRCVTVSVLIFVLILGSHVYTPLKMEVAATGIGHGITYRMKPSQLYSNHPDFFDGLSLCTKIMFVYIPLLSCLVINIMMIVALWNQRKQRRLLQMYQVTLNDKREVQTTVTILTSSFLFSLLFLPITANTIIERTIPEYGLNKRERYLYMFIFSFGGLLSLVGLSMDFFIYLILSQDFRQTFMGLVKSFFRHIYCGRKPVPHSGRLGKGFNRELDDVSRITETPNKDLTKDNNSTKTSTSAMQSDMETYI